jgi:hypothetical protein
MHLPDYHLVRGSLEDYASAQQAEEVAEVNEVSKDTIKFLEQYCKLKPYWYLLDLIQSYEQFQFNAVRWPRQTGKSTDIGALHLADAWNNPDLYIGFIGPSWRQTKLNIRRYRAFAATYRNKACMFRKQRLAFPMAA